MRKNVAIRAVPILLILSVFGLRQYSDYKETKQMDDFKSKLQSYLLEDSSKTNLNSVRIDGSTLALVININDQQVNDEIKAKLAANSRKILVGKVCNGTGLRDWLIDGNRVSIDIKANGDVYGLANISITDADCT